MSALSTTRGVKRRRRDPAITSLPPFHLEVTGLQVSLPTGPKSNVSAVRDVSLSVARGERVGIVGESGSGKSVTGRAIAGLLPASPRVAVRGSISYNGREYVGGTSSDWLEVRRQYVSMIFQDPLSSLNPTMRVGRQVAEVRRPKLTDEMVAHYLGKAGLLDSAVAAKYPFELSGGMRQRVSIAIALAKQPSLIVADEPTTALDATVQARVLASLDVSVREADASLLMISHDLAVIAKMCDRVYVMYSGEVVEHGVTRQVFEDPKAEYTKRLLRGVRELSGDRGAPVASERQTPSD